MPFEESEEQNEFLKIIALCDDLVKVGFTVVIVPSKDGIPILDIKRKLPEIKLKSKNGFW